MVRVHIQFTEEQINALRRISAETGRSVAELVRQAVDLYMQSRRFRDRDDVVERALSIAGKYSSGLKHIGKDHDRYLAEDFHT
jgi:hypothetical protein